MCFLLLVNGDEAGVADAGPEVMAEVGAFDGRLAAGGRKVARLRLEVRQMPGRSVSAPA